jgi:hypothetical protein
MAEIYWPAGVGDDPLRDSIDWQPQDNGAYQDTASSQQRSAPNSIGISVHLTAAYPMSDHQFNGLWLPWWWAKKSAGGCFNGTHAFWLRDPIDRSSGVRKPYRFVRQKGQNMRPVRDGLGWIVTLPLMRLPT